ncbi:MAG: protein-glutamate O-methyltransferase CheR [Ignavibacteriae bacterium]|nr:protein-glutamate O-methyltransferase CheR [Ignavibacteriota bacterium]MCB9206136.1 protein-glutamate O-methyltransferase CheR [Ignavibacteriales bacterium]MCB9209409.1 protein-glutamate O-methyltransferase CheR [Ignavibacteriales bacterium]MCB9258052.1 protein-glutamate O-methyltransferase CheR [Ignavibacteriales bacterium]
MLNSTATLRPSGLGNLNFGLNSSQEQKLTPQAFEQWRGFIYELCGIYFQDNKKYLLESRLQKRIKHLNIDSFENYLHFLKTHPTREEEKKQLYEAITINETYFFRNQPQLDALVASIVPDLLSNRPGGFQKLKIWSAASSSGEEAYSIAMMLNELILPKYPNLKVEIIGTDINYAVIDTANKGVFKEYSIRNTPPIYLKKYFEKEGNTYIIDPKIKSMVSFKYLNLYDANAMRMMSKSDVIFCANVLIYFNQESKIKVVDQLYNNLNQNGYLFIGYSETLHGISKAFKLVSFPKTIGYKKG